MGKSASPPDPYQTSDAQAAANTNAIKTSAKYSAVDQNAPWGSTTYTRDSEGVPTAQNISLGPSELANYTATMGAKNTLADKAGQYAGALPSTPFTMPDNARADAVQGALFNRRLSMVKPDLDEADTQAEVTLAERGIPVGSEVWTKEMDRLSRNRADTMTNIANDATLAGGQESDRLLQQALTTRNQGYNELGSLMSGASGAQMPTFQASPAYNAQAPNVAGNVYESYKAQQANNNSMNGGLFGIGNALLSLFKPSDIRVKKDIRRVGATASGLPVYVYRYAMGGPLEMGVMAQEVEEVMPDAVMTIGGIKHVDYGMIS